MSTVLQALASQGAAPDFSAQLRKLAEPPGDDWEHAVRPEERGLERWILSLAPHGRDALVTAAVSAGRRVYPGVVERAGDDAVSFAISEDAPSADGESIGKQLRRVEAWLASPDDETRQGLEVSFDPTRQLMLWDDDLRPPEEAFDVSWQWFMEVGQLCVAACLQPMEGATSEGSYYEWSAPRCAARAVVCSLKALRSSASLEADLGVIGRAIAASLSEE